jgi:tight adherence protein C
VRGASGGGGAARPAGPVAMTPAALLAVLAAVLAAAGMVEAGALLVDRRTRREPRDGRAGGRRSSLTLRLTWLGRRIGGPAPPADLARRLDAAGIRAGVRPGDVMALKCGAALAGLVAAMPVATLLPGRLGPVALVGAPAAAFLGPDAWLIRRARRRGRLMDEELADVTDLLRVAIAAGLPATRALAEVGRRHAGLLAGELRVASGRIALGVPSADALAVLVRRCPAEGVGPLVAALRRAERHGSPLGPALAAIAADARARRAQAIREHAAHAAPKIQLVVALLLVPAVMLLVAAALAAGLT